MKCAVSWSGGKDSCQAAWRALDGSCAGPKGLEVSFLLNMTTADGLRTAWHGIDSRLVELQAQATGFSLLQKRAGPAEYELAFREALRGLRELGVEAVIFGDICIDEHRTWVERVCRSEGVEAVEPLWGRNPADILAGFLRSGFKAVVAAAKAELFPAEWIGRPVDGEFAEFLASRGIDPCGESGEYHTFVIGGPLFRREIGLRLKAPILRDGYWFLEAEGYLVRQRTPD